ncbi:helix-turn-helix domain-containing protein, partial [Streptomyces lasiicapitis]|uniref:helix-turn-helix domain-containing protein n=1 Tax=Streptomyces lasiicapitis TaxID=1923961 RepID=UPI001667455C
MTQPDFTAIDSLLAAAAEPTPLPSAERRRALREALGLSRAQVARALSVSPSTVGGWEAGRDPSGEIRARYAYFLRGAEDKLRAREAAATEPAPEADERLLEAEPSSSSPAADTQAIDDQDELAEPQPCVLCGAPARHQVASYPQHLDPSECSATPPDGPTMPSEASTGPTTTTASGRGPKIAQRAVHARRGQGVPIMPAGRRVQAASDMPDLIGTAVAAALAEHAGDVDAATTALVKRAIPDAMALLDETRKGARYDVVAHPWIPDVLRKQSARGADQIWEARPKWTRPELPPGHHEVTALDINGAYLSALKTHLPIGQLEHSTGFDHNRRRAGVHLITPPDWAHEDVLPNPLGNRDEPGPLWVTEPTLRLLLRLSSPKYGLCEAPQIHESYTSGATENLLEKFRIALKDARDRAIADEDEVTLEYVKAMYSKFVSTMGESNYNREL